MLRNGINIWVDLEKFSCLPDFAEGGRALLLCVPDLPGLLLGEGVLVCWSIYPGEVEQEGNCRTRSGTSSAEECPGELGGSHYWWTVQGVLVARPRGSVLN